MRSSRPSPGQGAPFWPSVQLCARADPPTPGSLYGPLRARKPSTPLSKRMVMSKRAKAERPKFHNAWVAFQPVRVPVAQVGQKIGGKVQQNIDSKVFTNACPIRMSYVLNSTGHLIKTNQHPTVSGADGKRYLFRVSDMMDQREKSFGNPDKTAKSPSPAAFANLQGILVVRGHGWRDAKGHVTLWDGSGCSDTCHLLNDPENGTFVPDTASIWVLP